VTNHQNLSHHKRIEHQYFSKRQPSQLLKIMPR
jgi:hypothetical protein